MKTAEKVIEFFSIAYTIGVIVVVNLGWLYYHFITPIIAGWTFILVLPLDIFVISSLRKKK